MARTSRPTFFLTDLPAQRINVWRYNVPRIPGGSDMRPVDIKDGVPNLFKDLKAFLKISPTCIEILNTVQQSSS